MEHGNWTGSIDGTRAEILREYVVWCDQYQLAQALVSGHVRFGNGYVGYQASYMWCVNLGTRAGTSR